MDADKSSSGNETDKVLDEAIGLIERGQHEKAVGILREMWKTSDDPKVEAYLIMGLQKLGRHQEVIDFISEMDEYEKSSFLLELAESFYALGNYARVIEMIEDFLEDPEDCEPYSGYYELLEEAYRATGNHTEFLRVHGERQAAELKETAQGVKIHEKSIQHEPNDPKLYSDKAHTLSVLKDYVGAIEAIRSAITLDPDNQSYQSRLAEYEKRKQDSRN